PVRRADWAERRGPGQLPAGLHAPGADQRRLQPRPGPRRPCGLTPPRAKAGPKLPSVSSSTIGSRRSLATTPTGQPAGRLCKELPDGEGDFLEVRFQRKMSRVQQLNNRLGVISPKSLRPCGEEIGIVLAPDRQQRRLRRPKVFLEARVKLHVVRVV